MSRQLKRKRPYHMVHHVEAHVSLLPQCKLIGVCSLCGGFLHGIKPCDLEDAESAAGYKFQAGDTAVYEGGFRFVEAQSALSEMCQLI